jgi:ABC-2 type transport system ATP-binding protein
VLRVEGVTKRYRGVTAVDGLSFHVERQQIMALLGPNGAGKTTTVRMIQGIVPPDEGRVILDIPGATGAPRPGLGYLPEDRGLYKDQPIERTLRFFGRLRGLTKSEARDATESWLERFGLADRRRDKLDTLSKGNQQKVQFASAVLHRPAFAVLDEPFSGLDPVNQDAFLELLAELRDEGMTILLSAHQMELVERIADRVLLMARGREVLSGSLDELRGEGGSERLHDLYVRTVTADDDAAAAQAGASPEGEAEAANRGESAP